MGSLLEKGEERAFSNGWGAADGKLMPIREWNGRIPNTMKGKMG
ncbi:hypothetical protein EDC14_103017 [Hydrogenispora ethanolica]|uniref:Uncharacterized protein n=1 Tax=Hydrogenispora ethanolica TaxID=1082276 RepID=A0A4R1R8D3_HYDET|nr:hypothetical protein EDC14_103017 [Hydrogenispora ethanolica]